MVTRNRLAPTQWTLSDLVDFEALLARDGDAVVDQTQRQHFLRDIRPRLTDIKDAGERRRVGLRLWLEQRRVADDITTGKWFGHTLDLAGWVACALLIVMGMGLVSGLLLGAQQTAHVVIFFGLALVLPWLVFGAGAVAHLTGVGHGGLAAVVRTVLRFFASRDERGENQQVVLQAVTETQASQRVLSAVLAGLTQRGAVGFNVGLILAFVGCLLLFNVRFYWEATPQAGMDVVLSTAVQIIATPWGWLWPQAVPDMVDVASTRLLADAMPVAGDGSWWRFLLMSLLIWGLLPRLLLIALFRRTMQRALAQLDFQAARHRALWRQLSTVERGEVATGPVDGALILDVGGHGVTGASIRGFLLRRLRVNPQETLLVAVLDEQHEAQAEEALSAGPAGVVMLVESWTLSPRQIDSLHGRLRKAVGSGVPMIWLVFALRNGGPAAPTEADMQRWARTIDGLRDPAAEVVAYEG